MIKRSQEYENNDENVMNILQKFGKFQILQYFLICLPIVFTSVNNLNYVFVAGDIDYRCRIPECESSVNRYSLSWWPAGVDRCSKPIINYTDLEVNQCSNASFTSSVTECTEWIYGCNDTIVAWLNLACQPWKTNFVGTMRNLGIVLGVMIGGWCSDRFGRKPTYTVAIVGMMVGTIKTFTASYYAYIFIELVEGVLSGSAIAAGIIIMIEISNSDKRILAGVLFSNAIYTGEALLVGLAYLVSYWKTIIYVTCSPSIIFIFYAILLNESPRWQVLNDKLDEAKNSLKLIVKLNNIKINSQDLDNMDKERLRQVCNVESKIEKEGFREVFKSREILKRLTVGIIGRFSATLIYYGLIASSVWLSGNKYINYFISALMSFPGDYLAMYFMNRIGRKWSLVYGYLICGVTCIIFAYVPESIQWLKLLLFLIGKLMVTACFAGIWLYTLELFPTSVRGSLYGLCTIAASPGWMLAPLTPAMNAISPVFASMFFGCSAIFASLAITLTPETKGLPLVGTIEEVNRNIAVTRGKKKIVINYVNKGFEEDVSICVHL